MFLIEYLYPGTVNGEPVGRVYVQRVSWSDNVYSYTKQAPHATTWQTEAEAMSQLRKSGWNEGKVVAVYNATEVLP